MFVLCIHPDNNEQSSPEVIFQVWFLFFSPHSCPASHFNNVEVMSNYTLLDIWVCLFLLTLKNKSKYFFLEHCNYIIIALWDYKRFHVSTKSVSNNGCRKGRLLQKGEVLGGTSRPISSSKVLHTCWLMPRFFFFLKSLEMSPVSLSCHDSKLSEGRHLSQWRRKIDFWQERAGPIMYEATDHICNFQNDV